MAKGAYIGVDNVASKIKGGYIGVDGIARKIKKAYIGIGGVARPCWVGREVTSYGPITSLTSALYVHAATSFADYALFYGGVIDGNTINGDLMYYDKSLTRSSKSVVQNASDSTMSAYEQAAASNANYAIFHGGMNWNDPNSGIASNTACFDSSLTATWRYVSYSDGRTAQGMAGARAGEYALFEGASNGYSACAYDGSLTVIDPPVLNVTGGWCAATSLNGKAIFGGSYFTSDTTDIYSNMTTLFDESLTRTRPTALSVARARLSAARVGDHVLFAGGRDDSGCYSTVDAYDAAFTRTTAADLSYARVYMTGNGSDNFAVFTGGQGQSVFAVVDVYDSSLTRTSDLSLSEAKYEHAAATTGNYLVVAGGRVDNSNNGTSSAEAFTIA